MIYTFSINIVNPLSVIIDSIASTKEATSALDNKSERIVQRSLDRISKDRTVISIAHRISTIENCDKIIVIESLI